MKQKYCFISACGFIKSFIVSFIVFVLTLRGFSLDEEMYISFPIPLSVEGTAYETPFYLYAKSVEINQRIKELGSDPPNDFLRKLHEAGLAGDVNRLLQISFLDKRVPLEAYKKYMRTDVSRLTMAYNRNELLKRRLHIGDRYYCIMSYDKADYTHSLIELNNKQILYDTMIGSPFYQLVSHIHGVAARFHMAQKAPIARTHEVKIQIEGSGANPAYLCFDYDKVDYSLSAGSVQNATGETAEALRFAEQMIFAMQNPTTFPAFRTKFDQESQKRMNEVIAESNGNPSAIISDFRLLSKMKAISVIRNDKLNYIIMEPASSRMNTGLAYMVLLERNQGDFILVSYRMGTALDGILKMPSVQMALRRLP